MSLALIYWIIMLLWLLLGLYLTWPDYKASGGSLLLFVLLLILGWKVFGAPVHS